MAWSWRGTESEAGKGSEADKESECGRGWPLKRSSQDPGPGTGPGPPGWPPKRGQQLDVRPVQQSGSDRQSTKPPLQDHPQTEELNAGGGGGKPRQKQSRTSDHNR